MPIDAPLETSQSELQGWYTNDELRNFVLEPEVLYKELSALEHARQVAESNHDIADAKHIHNGIKWLKENVKKVREALCEQEYTDELSQLIAKRDEEAAQLVATWDRKAEELRDIQGRAVSNLTQQGEALESELDEREQQLMEAFKPSKRLLDLHKSVQALLWMRNYDEAEAVQREHDKAWAEEKDEFCRSRLQQLKEKRAEVHSRLVDERSKLDEDIRQWWKEHETQRDEAFSELQARYDVAAETLSKRNKIKFNRLKQDTTVTLSGSKNVHLSSNPAPSPDKPWKKFVGTKINNKPVPSLNATESALLRAQTERGGNMAGGGAGRPNGPQRTTSTPRRGKTAASPVAAYIHSTPASSSTKDHQKHATVPMSRYIGVAMRQPFNGQVEGQDDTAPERPSTATAVRARAAPSSATHNESSRRPQSAGTRRIAMDKKAQNAAAEAKEWAQKRKEAKQKAIEARELRRFNATPFTNEYEEFGRADSSVYEYNAVQRARGKAPLKKAPAPKTPTRPSKSPSIGMRSSERASSSVGLRSLGVSANKAGRDAKQDPNHNSMLDRMKDRYISNDPPSPETMQRVSNILRKTSRDSETDGDNGARVEASESAMDEQTKLKTLMQAIADPSRSIDDVFSQVFPRSASSTERVRKTYQDQVHGANRKPVTDPEPVTIAGSKAPASQPALEDALRTIEWAESVLQKPGVSNAGTGASQSHSKVIAEPVAATPAPAPVVTQASPRVDRELARALSKLPVDTVTRLMSKWEAEGAFLKDQEATRSKMLEEINAAAGK